MNNAYLINQDPRTSTLSPVPFSGEVMGLIKGEAEGQLVMNLKAEDQRTTPRVAVRFSAMVSGSVEAEGSGTILNLSRSGCRLESSLLMLPGLSLELRIAVPGLEWALTIDGADVHETEKGSGVFS